jgi:hypothetical protein
MPACPLMIIADIYTWSWEAKVDELLAPLPVKQKVCQPLVPGPLMQKWMPATCTWPFNAKEDASHLNLAMWCKSGCQPLVPSPLMQKWIPAACTWSCDAKVDGSHLYLVLWCKSGWQPLVPDPVVQSGCQPFVTGPVMQKWMPATFTWSCDVKVHGSHFYLVLRCKSGCQPLVPGLVMQKWMSATCTWSCDAKVDVSHWYLVLWCKSGCQPLPDTVWYHLIQLCQLLLIIITINYLKFIIKLLWISKSLANFYILDKTFSAPITSRS